MLVHPRPPIQNLQHILYKPGKKVQLVLRVLPYLQYHLVRLQKKWEQFMLLLSSYSCNDKVIWRLKKMTTIKCSGVLAQEMDIKYSFLGHWWRELCSTDRSVYNKGVFQKWKLQFKEHANDFMINGANAKHPARPCECWIIHSKLCLTS